MITLCPLCHREHLLGTRKPKDLVHCHCGKVFEVPPLVPFVPIAIRCSTCGGNVDHAAARCLYCHGAVRPFDVSSYCPRCCAYLAHEAKFCSHCGTGVRHAQEIPEITERFCPRDGNSLQGIPLGAGHGEVCPTCEGLWIGKDCFADIVQGLAGKELQIPAETSNRKAPFQSQVQYIKCPQCASQMNRRNFEKISGIIVDSCRHHGVWLDKHELFAVSCFVSGAGLQRAADRQKRDAGADPERLGAAQTHGYESSPSDTGIASIVEAIARLLS